MDVSIMIESHIVELEEFEKQFFYGIISEEEIFIKSQYFNSTIPMVQKISQIFNDYKEDEKSKRQILKLSSRLKAARLKYVGELKVLYLVSWT